MTRLALLASALLLVPWSSAAADPGHPLGRPAAKEAVRSLLESLDRDDADGSVAAAQALEASGGTAAAWGLSRLLRHRSPEVRAEVLRAATELGLREPELLARVRDLLGQERELDVLRAGCRTLGRIGDGSDVPWLLGLAQHEDRNVRLAAFRGLRALSGQRIGFVHERWTYWWTIAEHRATEEISAAIAALDAAPEDPLAPIHERALVRNGWIRLDEVRGALTRWLRADSVTMRALACRVISQLQLSEYAETLHSLLRFAFEEDTERAVHDALIDLGEVVPEPAAKQDDRVVRRIDVDPEDED